MLCKALNKCPLEVQPFTEPSRGPGGGFGELPLRPLAFELSVVHPRHSVSSARSSCFDRSSRTLGYANVFGSVVVVVVFFNLLHLCPGLRGFLISGVWLLVLLMGEDFLCADAGCEIRDFWFPWSEPPTKRLSPLVARLQQQRWLPAAQACLPSRQVLY